MPILFIVFKDLSLFQVGKHLFNANIEQSLLLVSLLMLTLSRYWSTGLLA